MWLIKAHTSQEAPTSTSGSSSLLINNGKYLLHVDYLYVDGNDISCLALIIIEKYINLLQEKDNALIDTLNSLFSLSNENIVLKKQKILELLTEDSEARIFEIIE